MKTVLVSIFLALSAAPVVLGSTLLVPRQYPTIQAGINAAVDGDTVLVSPGQYNEALNYSGKDIVVKSASGPAVTTIYHSDPNVGVTFNSQETRAAVLDGFKITGGMWSNAIACGPGTAPTIRGNIITNNVNLGGYFCAGGISASESSPLIENNQITNNTGIYYGGGISMGACSNAIVRNNVISNNYCNSGSGDALGGAIFARGSTAVIEYNLITDNEADYTWGFGGGIYFDMDGTYTVSHNTFSRNYASHEWWPDPPGGCICMGYDMNCFATIIFTDNIIVNSTGCDGLVCGYGNPTFAFHFNDVWNNTPANYYACSPGPDDISLNPQFAGGSPYSYRLTAGSPCIDAGAYTSLPDPDGTRSDLGAFPFDQTGMHVALVADIWPISIPAQGGSFGCTLHLTNHTSQAAQFDLWADILQSDSSVYGPLLLRQNLSFAPNEHQQRHLTQVVPGTVPAGASLYRVHLGDYDTGQILHEAVLPFTKTGAEALSSRGEENPVVGQPFSVSLWPNPFNPTTVASYELRVASQVSLKVYDTAGRLIITLVEGRQEAGDHRVTFDGSKLPSGVYLAQLTAGEFTATQKLILIK